MANTVTKRDGCIVPFDKEKISIAILKAMKYGSGIEKEKIANDISNEIEEELKVSTKEVLDYDYPSVLELSRMLSDLEYNLGRYIGLEIEGQGDSVKEIVATKIMTAINTCNEIYDMLFNN